VTACCARAGADFGDVKLQARTLAAAPAARTKEVLGARRSEINFAEKTWTVPAERMKAGKEHRVPLSARAVAILEEMLALQPAGDERTFVFRGAKPGKPLSNMAFFMLLRRMRRDDPTAHGFRSTFRDWAAERTNFPADVAEAALAHTIADKVQAAYQRGDLFEKRQRLMTAWATFCTTPVQEPQSNVAPLRRAGTKPNDSMIQSDPF